MKTTMICLHSLTSAAPIALCLGMIVVNSFAQTRPAAHTPAQTASLPKFKAIWEPVNYPEDIDLTDVFFVNGNVGWVTGGAMGGGMILNTQDGGEHWTVQWGDPHGTERRTLGLFFLDSTHGWARQGYNDLLRTSDGQLWVAGGKMDPYVKHYVFTSATTAIAITDNHILRTVDGGQTYPWAEVNHCLAKVQVDGLTRQVECVWSKLSFPTASVGYVVGFIPGSHFTVMGKTSDGGATWLVNVIDGLSSSEARDAWFFDPNTGFMRTGDDYAGHLQKTTDGGASWQPGASIRGRRMGFVDREVGWSFWGRAFYFTSDGGLRWNSRDLAFPAEVNAWSLPQRDRGYVVGSHGMIYRHRIVPVTYTSKGMLEAPVMPAPVK